MKTHSRRRKVGTQQLNEITRSCTGVSLDELLEGFSSVPRNVGNSRVPSLLLPRLVSHRPPLGELQPLAY